MVTACFRKTPFLLYLLPPLMLFASCAAAPWVESIPEESVHPAQAAMVSGEEQTDAFEFDAARVSFRAALMEYASLDDRDGTVQALLALGWTLQSGDPSAARVYYHHAGALASVGGDSLVILDVDNHRADLELRMGDAVAARDILGTEGSLGTSGGRQVAAWYRLYGMTLDSLGDTDDALSYLKKGVDIAVRDREYNEEAQGSYRVAVILSRIADFEGAREWAHRALDADKAAQYKPGIAADLQALAIISEKSGDQDAAEDYYRRAWLAWTGNGKWSDARSAGKALETITGRTVSLP